MAISLKPNWQLMKKLPKIGAIGGLVGAAAVALPVTAMVLRNRRRADENDMPPPPELTAPIPPVLDFTPQLMAQQQQQTLMGEPLVEGDFAQRYKNQRSGLGNGIDASSPNIMRADGRNAIDGSRAVEDLNAPASRGI